MGRDRDGLRGILRGQRGCHGAFGVLDRRRCDASDGGGRVRNWDPLFREIFDHRSEIVMEIETVEGGVRVTETSENPAVAALIKAHAYKVSEFVARGPAAVHEATPLPEGYGTDSADAPVVDGSDPRDAITGTPASAAVAVPRQHTMEIDQSSQVRARALVNGRWGALASANYIVDGSLPSRHRHQQS